MHLSKISVVYFDLFDNKSTTIPYILLFLCTMKLRFPGRVQVRSYEFPETEMDLSVSPYAMNEEVL